MDYTQECEFGAEWATAAIDELRTTRNLPAFKAEVLKAAKDESGIGVGFLTELTFEVMQ